jgi:hypothetical protein
MTRPPVGGPSVGPGLPVSGTQSALFARCTIVDTEPNRARRRAVALAWPGANQET